jgi:hypothetical protein
MPLRCWTTEALVSKLALGGSGIRRHRHSSLKSGEHPSSSVCLGDRCQPEQLWPQTKVDQTICRGSISHFNFQFILTPLIVYCGRTTATRMAMETQKLLVGTTGTGTLFVW